MIDGIDGSGKSTILNVMTQELQSKGSSIFNVPQWSKTNQKLPNIKDCDKANIILSAEPTNVWVGAAIREELIKSGREWNGKIIAKAFSLDRLILYKRLIIPLRENGKLILQDRGVSTSIIYQPIQNDSVNLEELTHLPGNKVALENPPDILIIAGCEPMQAIERLQKRSGKQDDSIFEKFEFLEKIHTRFHSVWFQEIWESRGTKVIYFNTNKNLDEMIITAKTLIKDLIQQPITINH